MPKSSPNRQSDFGTLQLVKSQSVPMQEVRLRVYELYQLQGRGDGLKVNTEKGANESCAPVTLKQRFEKLLREVFEGHEEYLGLTPD